MENAEGKKKDTYKGAIIVRFSSSYVTGKVTALVKTVERDTERSEKSQNVNNLVTVINPGRKFISFTMQCDHDPCNLKQKLKGLLALFAYEEK